MTSPANRTLNLTAAAGLALGAVFGMAGTFVTQDYVRSAAWAIDGAGLVMAASLLSMKYFRKGNDFVAAGFLVFALGEGVMLSGTAGNLADSVPSFAAGTALWATSLLLISLPREFATGVRLIGIFASVLFFVTSGQIFWGAQLYPTSSPLPFFAYPFLVLTFIGWIWSLLRET
jgi:hypothetical protein